MDPSVLTAAATALAGAVGGPVELVLVDELRPGRVARCRMVPAVAPGTSTSTVIVKAAEPGQAASRGLATVHNELAALTLLDAVAPRAAPRLLAAVADEGLLVLEDLGDGPSLATRLLGDDEAAAREAVRATAASLGRLQARTVGHADVFAAHRRRLGAVDLDRERFVLRGRDVRQVVGELPDQLRRHGLPDLRPVAAGVRDVVDELADPGDFLALSTGDPCPDNGRITDDGVRLFDFEAAAFRHALVDAAHYRVPFPNCWCWRRLPEDVARAAQAAHQEAFTGARPGTRTGDPAGFTVSLGRMATAWALWTLHRRLPAAETSRVERRRILQTLTNLRAVTSEAPHLGDTATWAEALHRDLAQRWPADRGPAATYPAFGGPPWDGC